MMEKGKRFTVSSLAAVALLWLLSLSLIKFAWTVVESWVHSTYAKGQLFSIEH
jgi:hypothetical protein